ncbi:MAG: PIN domain-containing protein [Deltaproteobacteria bacterium]|nr:PIN domain-containing protein [Deltaproteobacteria bacterium]
MKKYILDTNALISFVTDRNPAQQEIVAPLFETASRLKCFLVCHQFVLTEFVFVMDKVYGTPKETINAMLRDLIAMPGIEVRQETDFSALLSYWPSKIADFGDALIAATGKSIKGAIIVTFDEKFKSALKKLGQDSF